MELSKLIIPSKTVDFEYPGVDGLVFSLAYLSRKKLTQMRKDHIKTTRNKATKQFVEELDEDSFMKEYTTSVLCGWKGLNSDNIQEFLVIDTSELEEVKGIPYTPSNAYELMVNSQELDTWIADKISDIENFRDQESKNKSE